jgi:hypothetical protein
VKVWAPKVGNSGIPIWESRDKMPFGSLETKCHLDVALVERLKKYYKGEGGGFPQVRAVMNLAGPNLLVTRPNTKSAQIMH